MLNSITLLGSSSGRNAGDAALISGIMDSVDHCCNRRVQYEIPTIRPSYIREHYQNDTQPISMLPWNASVKMLGIPTYKSIMRTDLSLLFDAILFDRSLYNPLFNFMSTLYLMLPRAKAKGKRMGFFNVGAGPVDSKHGQKMLRELGNMMDFITVRDQASFDILKEVGVDNPRMLLCADAAVLVTPSPDTRVDDILRAHGLKPDEDFLAINVNQYLDTWARPKRKPMGKDKFVETYAETLRRVNKAIHVPVVFVTTQHHDVAISEAIIDRIKEDVSCRLITNVQYNHYDIKGVLGRAQLLFGMRLHANILGSSALAPILGLAYQPKVQFYFDSLNLSEFCITFDEFNPDDLTRNLLYAWENRSSIRDTLHTGIPALQRKARVAAQLVTALDRGGDLDHTIAKYQNA